MDETMVRSGLPKPIGGYLGVIPKAMLAFSKRVLRPLGCSYVSHRTDKLDVARCVFHRVSHGVDMFHRSVRHEQSIFMREVLPVSSRAIYRQLNGSTIVRMGT